MIEIEGGFSDDDIGQFRANHPESCWRMMIRLG